MCLHPYFRILDVTRSPVNGQYNILLSFSRILKNDKLQINLLYSNSKLSTIKTLSEYEKSLLTSEIKRKMHKK